MIRLFFLGGSFLFFYFFFFFHLFCDSDECPGSMIYAMPQSDKWPKVSNDVRTTLDSCESLQKPNLIWSHSHSVDR
jgi:hypothetical protein